MVEKSLELQGINDMLCSPDKNSVLLGLEMLKQQEDIGQLEVFEYMLSAMIIAYVDVDNPDRKWIVRNTANGRMFGVWRVWMDTSEIINYYIPGIHSRLEINFTYPFEDDIEDLPSYFKSMTVDVGKRVMKDVVKLSFTWDYYETSMERKMIVVRNFIKYLERDLKRMQ